MEKVLFRPTATRRFASWGHEQDHMPKASVKSGAAWLNLMKKLNDGKKQREQKGAAVT